MSKTEMEAVGPRRPSAAVSEQSTGAAPTGGAGRRVSRMEHAPPGMLHISRKMSIMRRMSIASRLTDNSTSMKPTVKLQNTYRLGPEKEDMFKAHEAEELIKRILGSFLEGETYDQKKAAQLSKNIAEVVRARMREMHLPRYKFVCHVIIGQNHGQCMMATSRAAWNCDTDNFASATFKNASIVAISTVFACYYE